MARLHIIVGDQQVTVENIPPEVTAQDPTGAQLAEGLYQRVPQLFPAGSPIPPKIDYASLSQAPDGQPAMAQGAQPVAMGESGTPPLEASPSIPSRMLQGVMQSPAIPAFIAGAAQGHGGIPGRLLRGVGGALMAREGQRVLAEGPGAIVNTPMRERAGDVATQGLNAGTAMGIGALLNRFLPPAATALKGMLRPAVRPATETAGTVTAEVFPQAAAAGAGPAMRTAGAATPEADSAVLRAIDYASTKLPSRVTRGRGVLTASGQEAMKSIPNADRIVIQELRQRAVDESGQRNPTLLLNWIDEMMKAGKLKTVGPELRARLAEIVSRQGALEGAERGAGRLAAKEAGALGTAASRTAMGGGGIRPTPPMPPMPAAVPDAPPQNGMAMLMETLQALQPGKMRAVGALAKGGTRMGVKAVAPVITGYTTDALIQYLLGEGGEGE